MPRSSRRSTAALARCAGAIAACTLLAPIAGAASLAAKAQESGCASKPILVEGNMYKCTTKSGYSAYFNVPNLEPGQRGSAASAATPPGFPKVDSKTQKGRDDVRRKVLTEELATEEKLLADAQRAYANGAPTPLPEEREIPQKYADRVYKLRQVVSLHEKNIEALKKELGATR
jgi:hypothetical protein